MEYTAFTLKNGKTFEARSFGWEEYEALEDERDAKLAEFTVADAATKLTMNAQFAIWSKAKRREKFSLLVKDWDNLKKTLSTAEVAEMEVFIDKLCWGNLEEKN